MSLLCFVNCAMKGYIYFYVAYQPSKTQTIWLEMCVSNPPIMRTVIIQKKTRSNFANGSVCMCYVGLHVLRGFSVSCARVCVWHKLYFKQIIKLPRFGDFHIDAVAKPFVWCWCGIFIYMLCICTPSSSTTCFENVHWIMGKNAIALNGRHNAMGKMVLPKGRLWLKPFNYSKP